MVQYRKTSILYHGVPVRYRKNLVQYRKIVLYQTRLVLYQIRVCIVILHMRARPKCTWYDTGKIAIIQSFSGIVPERRLVRYPASSGAVLGSSVVRQCGVLGARCDTRQDRRACRLFLGTRDRGRVPRKQVGIGRFPLGSEGGQKRGRLWRLLFSLSFLLSLSLLFSHPLLFSSSFLFSFFLPGPPGPGRARKGPRRREEGTGPCRRRQFSEDGGVFGGDEVF